VKRGTVVAWQHLSDATAGSRLGEVLAIAAINAAYELLGLDKGLRQLPQLLAQGWPEDIMARPNTITVVKTGEVGRGELASSITMEGSQNNSNA
jgi:hypothetical protein